VVQISPATLAICNVHFIGQANFAKHILCGVSSDFLEVALSLSRHHLSRRQEIFASGSWNGFCLM